jgi:hypothetical protein
VLLRHTEDTSRARSSRLGLSSAGGGPGAARPKQAAYAVRISSALASAAPAAIAAWAAASRAIGTR